MATKTIQKRKTYSLDPIRAQELARVSVDLTEQLGKSVSKQSILDCLVFGLVRDEKLMAKVRNSLKSL